MLLVLSIFFSSSGKKINHKLEIQNMHLILGPVSLVENNYISLGGSTFHPAMFQRTVELILPP
jgi:hypothetical protein